MEEGFPEIPLNNIHKGANLWSIPLKILPLELQLHPQTGVGHLGMLCGDF